MDSAIEQQIKFLDELIEALTAQRTKLSLDMYRTRRREHLGQDELLLLTVIKHAPGMGRAAIVKKLPEGFDYQNKVTTLRRHKKIVNLGTRRSPKWYPVAKGES